MGYLLNGKIKRSFLLWFPNHVLETDVDHTPQNLFS